MPTMNLVKQSEDLPTWIKSTEQNALFIASGKPKVREFNSVEQFNELNEFMKWWRMQLGITVIANHSEPQMNIIHIKELYNDLSIEDFKLAVKYSFMGVLGVDFIAYNSFSPLYISKILNAYKLYRDAELNAIGRAKMSFDRELEMKKLIKTEQEIDLLNRQARQDNYNLIKNSSTLVNVIPGVWNIAVAKGWVDSGSLHDVLLRSAIETEIGKIKGSPEDNPAFRVVNEDEVIRFIKYKLLKDYFTTNEINFLTLE
jgi:hypothetical protein